MMYNILMLLTIYSISFAIKETSLLDKPRNYITRNSVFAYKLISCIYCLSFHVGYIVYVIFSPVFIFKEMVLWAFTGAIFSLIMNGIINKLYEGIK